MAELQQLQAENEELRWRLQELLGSGEYRLRGFKPAAQRAVNLLAKRAPNVVSYEALLHAVSNNPLYVDDARNLVKVQMYNARQSLAELGVEVTITPHAGEGYSMDKPSALAWNNYLNEYHPGSSS